MVLRSVARFRVGKLIRFVYRFRGVGLNRNAFSLGWFSGTVDFRSGLLHFFSVVFFPSRLGSTFPHRK